MSEVTNSANCIIITVKSSPSATHQSQLTIVSRDVMSAISRAIKVKADRFPITDRYVTLRTNGLEQTYELDKEGNVFDRLAGNQLRLSDKWKNTLKTYGDSLAKVHYGELLTWEEVKNKIPNKSNMTVIDLETGLAFQVQRRAGKHHADVQPLTKQDTKIMKQIYNGKWSWKRKAILILKDHHYYAASMQGMPHGGGSITGNGFPGHFCIHFLDSKVHRSLNKDPEHHLMIHKAAGNLDSYFQNINPYELVDSFIGVVNLKESQIFPYYFMDTEHSQLPEIRSNLENIRSFRKLSETKKEFFEDKLAVDIPVEVGVEYKRKGAETLKLMFHVRRKSLISPWKINHIEGLPDVDAFSPVMADTKDKQVNASVQLRINLWHQEIELIEDGKIVKTFKIAPGAIDTPSPVGIYRVVAKDRGWGGGFGSCWLGLNVPWGQYGIHGTNRPGLIGKYVSHGCFRMKNRDIEEIYELVPVGTEVIIEGPITGHKDVTYRVLVRGSRGALVQLVQNRLQAAGLYNGPCNGIFNRETERAVIRYQKQNNLPVTKQIHYEDLLHLGIIE
jgi:hypothetical protein